LWSVIKKIKPPEPMRYSKRGAKGKVYSYEYLYLKVKSNKRPDAASPAPR
jgi:hypothetical protein